MLKKVFDLFHYLRKKYWKLFNIETFGVRTLIIDAGRILLVKHRYGNLWVMPGGKIDKNEDVQEAALRELKEEVGISAQKIDYELGYYKNTTGGKDDHVHCFVVTNFEKVPNFKQKFIDFLEVSKAEWFDLNNLPVQTSRATIARISEFRAGKRDLVGDW